MNLYEQLQYRNLLEILKSDGFVCSGCEYITKKYNIDNKDEFAILKHEDEMSFAQQIIALEIAIYVLKKTPGMLGESVDSLKNQRVKRVYEYKKKFNYKDYNKGMRYR